MPAKRPDWKVTNDKENLEIHEGENDFNFAPMAPAQADRFQNALRIHSSVAGHELPSRSDRTFNSIIDFIRAGLN